MQKKYITYIDLIKKVLLFYLVFLITLVLLFLIFKSFHPILEYIIKFYAIVFYIPHFFLGLLLTYLKNFYPWLESPPGTSSVFDLFTFVYMFMVDIIFLLIITWIIRFLAVFILEHTKCNIPQK